MVVDLIIVDWRRDVLNFVAMYKAFNLFKVIDLQL